MSLHFYRVIYMKIELTIKGDSQDILPMLTKEVREASDSLLGVVERGARKVLQYTSKTLDVVLKVDEDKKPAKEKGQK